MCIKNNYLARELSRQIARRYYQRYMLSNDGALESVEKTINEDDIPATRILELVIKFNDKKYASN